MRRDPETGGGPMSAAFSRWLPLIVAPTLLAAAAAGRAPVRASTSIAALASPPCVQTDSIGVDSAVIGITQVLPAHVPLASFRLASSALGQRARWVIWDADSLLPRSNTLVLRNYATASFGGGGSIGG